MRLLLHDDERRPDPPPVKTDDRKPIALGLGLWLVALVVLLFLPGPLAAAGNSWWLWTCVVGVVIGLIGLVYTVIRQR